MFEKINQFLNELLPKITKEEAETILDILKWDDETKAAFKLAKKIFEEQN